MKATAITYETLVGVHMRKFPVEYGNCFGVLCDDGKERKVVNFYAENLRKAAELGIEWPIEVKPLNETICVIHDSRIPDDWYSDRFCEICCPKALLPINQLHAHERAIAGGWRTEKDFGHCIDTAKMPKLGEPKPVPQFTYGGGKVFGSTNFPKG